MKEAMKKLPDKMYKDRMFRMIFSDRKELLSLYNAINNTNYDNPEELEVNTLENAIYLNMRNDLSFVIDSQLSLYEHQSTYNPNIPLRNLFYVSDLYEKITRDNNLYRHSIVKIPTPHFVTFYNGVEKQPERQIMKLSEAFEKVEESHALELQVLILNINLGYNNDLLEHCRTLRDYMTYVERVRTYTKEYTLEEAVELAIEECIQSDVLADFLRTNQSEVKHMSIYEFDAEKYERQVREEAGEEAREKLLMELIGKKIAKGNTPQEVAEIFEIPLEKVEEIVRLLQAEKSE